MHRTTLYYNQACYHSQERSWSLQRLGAYIHEILCLVHDIRRSCRCHSVAALTDLRDNCLTPPWYQLSTSLGRAEKVIAVLQDELQSMLRSRYESRSRSRFSNDWQLESLEIHEEDVRHETETLWQILQYMQLLETAVSTPRGQAEPQELVEDSTTPHGSLPILASFAGGSQADTEITLDSPAPPYHLVDV